MFFIYYYLLALSILGYGYFLGFSLKLNNQNMGVVGFNGIFLLILISYLSTFFLPHNIFFNMILLSIGIILLIFFYYKKNLRPNLFLHFIVFLILVIFILSGKNHDDFPYYHFSYTHILTQFNHPIGLGLINNGFRNPSSLFFFNSLFYLPKIDIFLYHIGSVFFLGYANLFFLKNIFDIGTFKRNKFYNFLNLAFFIFVNIFFYRLSEYGTDRAGQILVLIIFIILTLLLNDKSKKLENYQLFQFLIIISCITISLKPFYLIYFSLLFYFIFNQKIREYFGRYLRSKLFVVSLVYIFFTFLITFLNSSCLIFPAEFTCFENLSWSISKEEVHSVRDWYELWSKAGATPNNIVENRANYIVGFNWVPNWIDNYFFNKVTDYLLSLILISILFFYTLKQNQKSNQYIREYKILYLFLIFYIVEWFLYHPALRYGGYHLFALLLFIPLIFRLEKYNINWDFYFKRAIILIFISSLIFISRNILRLQKEYKVYDYNILENTNYKFTSGDLNFYLRYDEIIRDKKFNYEYIKILGKSILIIKK